ncbi:MAG: nucleotide pyrophosphohydrolase [Bacteroidia bacterium]|nr:nucleotide pyrophosphohydrolase [Bacteroidia bacterium]
MSDLKDLTAQWLAFRDAREWAQFHNPKDLALGLSIEAAELNELFLWKHPDEADREKVKEELADVFGFAILMAHHYGFDIREIVEEKLQKNAAKYPVDKAKGSNKKYTEL